MKIYGDERSGNCLKVRWTCDFLGLGYEWVEVLALTGATDQDWFRALNPAGQVPCVQWPDGRVLAQSNAIIWHLAETSSLIPTDPFARAKMLEWLFWEQYSHEPYLAVRRARIHLMGLDPASLDPALLSRGLAALKVMDTTLNAQDWFSGADFGLADIALLPYTRFAPQGGYDLAAFPAVTRWIGACERHLRLQALVAATL
jgi:glutathione S-transferase